MRAAFRNNHCLTYYLTRPAANFVCHNKMVGADPAYPWE